MEFNAEQKHIIECNGIVVESIEPKKILEIVSEENPLIVKYYYNGQKTVRKNII